MGRIRGWRRPLALSGGTALLLALAPATTGAADDDGPDAPTAHLVYSHEADELDGGTPRHTTELDGEAVFGVSGSDRLVISDGTTDGTRDIAEDRWANPTPSDGSTLDGSLYFPAGVGDDNLPATLWRTDGTPGDGEQVIDLDELDVGPVREIKTFDDRVAFTARDDHPEDDSDEDPERGLRLFLVDDSEGGASPVSDIVTEASEGYGVSVDGALYVGSLTLDGDVRLHRVDPDGSATTVWAEDAFGEEEDDVMGPVGLTTDGEHVYFRTGPEGEFSLFQHDVEAGTTRALFDAQDDDIEEVHAPWEVAGDRVFARVSPEERAGSELWAADVDSGGISTSFWPFDEDDNWGVESPDLAVAGDRLAFVAPRGTDDGTTWWVTDGTSSGTEQLQDDDGDPLEDTATSASPASTSEHAWLSAGFDVWQTDGTPDGTVAVEPELRSNDHFGVVDDELWLAANREPEQFDTVLWRVGEEIEDDDPEPEPEPEAGAIDGTVSDTDTGQAVDGAAVSADGPEAATTTTDPDGAFGLDDLAPGTYTITADADGYQPTTLDDVEVTDGETTTLDLPLAAADDPDPQTACAEQDLPDPDFTDVDEGDVHAPGIGCLVFYDIVQGTTDDTFSPTQSVTRAQMAAFVARTLDAVGAELPDVDDDAFDDIDAPHAQAISQLADLDLVQGIDEDTYAPEQTVTRAQTASMIVRAIEHIRDEPLDTPDDATFDDVDDDNVHADAIDAAADAGIVLGTTDTTFDPDGDTRRDQMATIIARTLDHLTAHGHHPDTPDD